MTGMTTVRALAFVPPALFPAALFLAPLILAGCASAPAAPSKTYVTQLEVCADKVGYVQSSQLIKSSGYAELDAKALAAAAPGMLATRPGKAGCRPLDVEWRMEDAQAAAS
ncbi:MAG: hypothetical protein R3C52_14635 [Hyphomonadaceae bacterium]